MTERNLRELGSLVESESIEIKIPSLDEGIRQVVGFIEIMLAEFERSDHRYFIYERMRIFGSMIIDPLKDIWHRSENQECRILAALIIIKYDTELVQSFLLSELRPDSKYVCMIVRYLVAERISEAPERIIDCLRALPLSQSNEIVCLIDHLRALNHEVPVDIVDKLVDPDAPIEIKVYVDKMRWRHYSIKN